jgi:DnaJ-class molecular chaperone
MDCPTCHGNGELESIEGIEEQSQHEGKDLGLLRERAAWPYACPTCGGSGYLEESF